MQGRLMREHAECWREVVAALQSMILPERLAAVPGYDLGSVYRPAREEESVGGDFYDFYPLGRKRRHPPHSCAVRCGLLSAPGWDRVRRWADSTA